MSTDNSTARTADRVSDRIAFKTRIARVALIVAIAGVVACTVIAYQDRVAREEAEQQREIERSKYLELSASAKTAKEEAQRERDAALRKLDEIEESLGEQNKALTAELRRLTTLEEAHAAENAGLKAELQKAAADAREMADRVEVVSEPAVEIAGDQTGSPIAGEVMAVSTRPDLNLMIINVGKNCGLAPGDQLNVYRGDKVITKIQIEKVERDWAAASSLKELEVEPAQVGDSVRP
ncbi:MAG: hypothetical protein RDV41_04205 [Planctomycetota bacterium]|nr:hypothetical protein [Planctomycetota bacterium]